MLAVTMTMSTFSLFALAVLSSDLEAEFGLSKFELGMIGAVNTGVGGLTAPLGGRVADKMGGRFAMGAVIVSAGVTNALAAVSPSYIFLLVVMAIAGVPKGWGNPATNKAIATGVVAEKRGLLTGLKQSGVQLGAFASGFFLPPIAEAWSWRAGMWCLAGIALIALVGLRAITVLDDDEHGAARGLESHQRVRSGSACRHSCIRWRRSDSSSASSAAGSGVSSPCSPRRVSGCRCRPPASSSGCRGWWRFRRGLPGVLRSTGVSHLGGPDHPRDRRHTLHGSPAVRDRGSQRGPVDRNDSERTHPRLMEHRREPGHDSPERWSGCRTSERNPALRVPPRSDRRQPGRRLVDRRVRQLSPGLGCLCDRVCDRCCGRGSSTPLGDSVLLSHGTWSYSRCFRAPRRFRR